MSEDIRVELARKALAASKAADDTAAMAAALRTAKTHWGETESALATALAAYDEMKAERDALAHRVELLEQQADVIRQTERAEADRRAYEAMDGERRMAESRRSVDNVTMSDQRREIERLTTARNRLAGMLATALGCDVTDLPEVMYEGREPLGGATTQADSGERQEPVSEPPGGVRPLGCDSRVVQVRALLETSMDSPPVTELAALAKWWSRMETAVGVLLTVIDERDSALRQAADELDRITGGGL